MASADTGEGVFRGSSRGGRKSGRRQRKIDLSENDFLDDHASQLSTQTVASVEESDIYGQGTGGRSNEEGDNQENKGNEMGVVNGSPGATLLSIPIAHEFLLSESGRGIPTQLRPPRMQEKKPRRRGINSGRRSMKGGARNAQPWRNLVLSRDLE